MYLNFAILVDFRRILAITSLLDAIDIEAEELLPRSIFIITRRYKKGRDTAVKSVTFRVF